MEDDRWVKLTSEEIDDVLAMLEDTGATRGTYLSALARLLARLGRDFRSGP